MNSHNHITMDNPLTLFLSWVLYVVNMTCGALVMSTDLVHITQMAELVKVILAIICGGVSTLILYIVNEHKVKAWLKKNFKK